jgi:predicted class III extradiol MEMO1 family dioxygenase
MSWVRPPAVAGTFYPSDPSTLRGQLEELFREAAESSPSPAPGFSPVSGTAPKALIAPHAGFVYSGPVAAAGYARLTTLRKKVKRVVLLGPAHRIPFRGIAACTARAFETPLGTVPLDQSIEEFSLIPLVVGEADVSEVADVLGRVWGGAETLVIVSSDLSHYLPYAEALELDEATSGAIEALDPEGVGSGQACGRIPVGGLLIRAREEGLSVRRIDLRNSGDTAGSRDQVVGYGCWLFA